MVSKMDYPAICAR